MSVRSRCLIGLLASLVIIGCPQPASVIVPDLTNLTQAQAQAALLLVGLKAGNIGWAYSDTVAAGWVIDQGAAAGSSASSGTAVDFDVSAGVQPVSAPDVTLQSQADAQTAILAAGLTVGMVTPVYSVTTPVGTVISQQPVPGSAVMPGSAVNLVISLGPKPIPVPNVAGLTQSDASAAIAGAGLTTGTVTQAYSATVPTGNVVSQDPAAGAMALPGSAVNLVVSQGPQPMPVPNVVGKTQSDAQAAVVAAGFSLGPIVQGYSATVPAGVVMNQNPTAGSLMLPGGLVDLVVSQGAQPVAVPNIVGRTQADAQAVLTGAGFSVGTVTQAYSATVPTGTVISQDPATGTVMPPGTAINLVISQGPQPVTVPDVRGKSQADAQTALTNAGLSVGAVTQAYSATVPSGSVISQNPAAQSSVPPGTAVSLVLSQGPQPVTVPDVRGKSQADAQTALTNAGLSVGAVTQAYSATVPSGSVISQNPAAQSSVPPGTAVSLILSQGPQPVPVPDVTGQAQTDAQTALTSAGFIVGAVTQQNSDTVPSGTVISQDPAAGTLLVPGSPVNLTVSEGPETLSSCDYFPLAVGNTWVTPGSTGANGSSLEVSNAYVVHGFECWEMTTIDYSQGGKISYYYVTYVNGWLYEYENSADLQLLPLVAPNADRTYPQFFTPGVSFVYNYNTGSFTLPLTVTPMKGRLSDFLTNISSSPFGDVQDVVALKTNILGTNIILYILGRNIGPLYYNELTTSGYYTSITVVGGCDATAQTAFTVPDLLGNLFDGMQAATPDYRIEAAQ